MSVVYNPKIEKFLFENFLLLSDRGFAIDPSKKTGIDCPLIGRVA